MDKSQVWLQCFTASLTGALAAERQDFSYAHRADVAKAAATVADFACGEFVKRFGPFQKEER